MNRIGLSVVLVGLGVATGALVSSGLAEPAAATRGPGAENVTALRKQRRDILRDAALGSVALYRKAKIDQEPVLRLTAALLSAELELAPDRAARIALRQQTIEQFQALEELATARFENARAPQTEILEAKAARLQAEIDLLLETADEK